MHKETSLLTLIEASEVNDPHFTMPAATVHDAPQPDEKMLLTLRAAVKTAGKAVGGKTVLARMLGINRQALYQWQKIPAERVIEIERLTGVRREVLRPDLYQRPTLTEALEMVRTAGYRVSKPKHYRRKGKHKDRVGPTFVAEFADGTITRMSTFTSLKNLDWDRGERLSVAAYQSRWRMQARERVGNGRIVTLWAPPPPAIVSAHFERDGEVLAQRNNEIRSAP